MEPINRPQHAETDADHDADQHPPQRHVEVFPQQVACVSADTVVGGGNVDEGVPHRARVGHEGLVPDACGGGELPQHCEDDDGQQRQCGVGQPATPATWCGGGPDRRVDTGLIRRDIDEDRH
jgi:hypothetical protein